MWSLLPQYTKGAHVLNLLILTITLGMEALVALFYRWQGREFILYASPL